MEEIKPYHDI